MTIAPDTHQETVPSADELEELEDALSALAGRVETVATRLERIGGVAVFEEERAEVCGQVPPDAPLVSLAHIGRLFIFSHYASTTAAELHAVSEQILGSLLALDCMERERASS